MNRRAIARGLCVASAIALWPALARAYPQWQLSTGVNRCDQCHLAPSGGGLLSEFGRQVDGDRLSTFAGDGAFLHGAARLPPWLAMGANGSGGFVSQVNQGSNAVTPAYPVTGQAQAAVVVEHVTIYGTLDVRGQIHGDNVDTSTQTIQPLADPWLASTEHWLMWRADESRSGEGLYVRAGRFFAPFGLRLALDAAFVRRELGFGLSQQTYNLSSGYIAGRWELHVTGFAPSGWAGAGSNETGAAAYFERRLGRSAAVAIQAEYARSPGAQRVIGGAVGKVYLARIKTLLFVEADSVLLSVDGLAARGQAVGAAGLAVLPFRGATITGLGEHFQEDLQARAAARDAATLMLAWLPYAHTEVQVLARVELPAGGATTKALFAQLRYWL
jgi:hypothetical protein